jgi:hypothetical protein
MSKTGENRRKDPLQRARYLGQIINGLDKMVEDFDLTPLDVRLIGRMRARCTFLRQQQERRSSEADARPLSAGKRKRHSAAATNTRRKKKSRKPRKAKGGPSEDIFSRGRRLPGSGYSRKG